MKRCGVYLLIMGGLSGCGGDKDEVVAIQSALEGVFPTQLSVASPLRQQVNSASNSGLPYATAVSNVNRISTSISHFTSQFDPTYFLGNSLQVDCFGPPILYQNHPDGPANNTGTLPSGDVGIWLETQGTDGEACAAAQLNTQLGHAANKSYMALITFAGMVMTAAANGIAMPSAGSSIDLVDELDARGLTHIDFTVATIQRSTAGDYTYHVSFEYNNPNAVSGAALPQTISLKMAHRPGASTSQYEGVIQYQVDDYFDPSGNCTADSGRTGTNVTQNGSLHYTRIGDSIGYQHRSAGLCGHDQSAFDDTIATSTLKHVSPTSLWKNNFSIFTTDFNQQDQSGRYNYTWQAGDGDADARILFVGLNSNQTNGEAYYGYGDRVQTSTNGEILGFYCNWAGPGGAHTRHPYAQRQHITYNSSKQLFEPTNTAASDITYAPTDSCVYTADISGQEFRYDTDVELMNWQPNSTALDNETQTTAFVYASGAPSGFKTLDLMDRTLATTTYSSIMDVIRARGFNQPVYPK